MRYFSQMKLNEENEHLINVYDERNSLVGLWLLPQTFYLAITILF